MRYFLHISYKGTPYHGWQRQTNAISVQQVLEDHLSKMMGTRIICHGCGRTDAGVHASQYFCNIDIAEKWNFDFIFRINKMLPHTIVVHEIIPVAEKANTQYDAIRRTYTYFFHFQKNAFLHDLSSFYLLENLDFEKIKKAVELLNQNRDYRAFCISPDFYKTTICEVGDAQVFINKEKTKMRFEISSNRFLRGMIRILSAHLLDVGTGKLSLDKFEHHLVTGERPRFHNIAYPQGLYLSKIEYPYLSLPANSNFLNFNERFIES